MQPKKSSLAIATDLGREVKINLVAHPAAIFYFKRIAAMNRSILISALLATLALAACDKRTVVNVPATPATPAAPVVVPGPPGPQGATGSQGNEGSPGVTGKPGESSTVIVMPPASAPAN